MKRLFFIALTVSVFIGCKNDTTSKDAKEIEAQIAKQQSENLTLLKGNFVYHDGAAVLQTANEIYGVLITDKMEQLSKKAERFKSEPTDMVQIEIKGKVTTQKDDKILWEKKVEIVEILHVKPAPNDKNNVVKLGNE